MRKKNLIQKVLSAGKDVEKMKGELEEHLKTSKREIKKANNQIVTLKCMTRTFWECWRWEVEKRKEEFLLNRSARVDHVSKSSVHSHNIHLIDSCSLHNSGEAECYLGRGSFGVVTYKMYRKSTLEDVEHEARMMDCLCHPFLPYLFGICTTAKPFKIVIQFHGFIDNYNSPLSITVRRQQCIGLNDTDWISTCAQLLEALDYLHNEAFIIHNDSTKVQLHCWHSRAHLIQLIEFY